MNRDNEIRELFANYGLQLMRGDVWSVQGQTVVRHKALERLGAAINITWESPKVVRAKRDECVLMIKGGIRKEGELPSFIWEWSMGEAVMGQNYKTNPKVAAYPYAMAEKRGKDRVILKLAGLHGIYSEEEADDFKSRDDAEATKPLANTNSSSKPSKEVYIDKSIDRMKEMASAPELLEWAKKERKMVWPQYGIEPHDEDGQKFVKAYKDRMAVLEKADETGAVE